jgi:signal transduction histidine kinase
MTWIRQCFSNTGAMLSAGDAMKATSTRTASWSVVAVVTLLLTGIGVIVGRHINSVTENATVLARPHEVQTALQRIGAAIDALDDSVQDYIIEGTQAAPIRFQYDDAASSLRARTAELGTLGRAALSASDLAEVDRRVAEALSASKAVIDVGNTKTKHAETLRWLAEEGRATNAANRKLDALIADQQQLLQAREWALRNDVDEISSGLIAAAAIVLCVLAGTIVLVEFDQRRQDALRDHLRSENERLESAVQERSETLALANRELTWFSKRALQIQEQERRSLALELHDQIGQELAALVFTLTRCERDIAPAARSDVRSALQQSIEIARAAYGDVHNLALDLRPAMLDRLGLIPTLQWYARQQAKHGRCEITVEADEFPARLPSDLLIAAYRIVQEAVSNAVRHGNPRRIEIHAHFRAGCIELQIRDDGIGFDPSVAVAEKQEPSGGLGLIGIRQRAADAGGHVSIRSEPGSGTEIVALLSVPETADSN